MGVCRNAVPVRRSEEESCAHRCVSSIDFDRLRLWPLGSHFGFSANHNVMVDRSWVLDTTCLHKTELSTATCILAQADKCDAQAQRCHVHGTMNETENMCASEQTNEHHHIQS